MAGGDASIHISMVASDLGRTGASGSGWRVVNTLFEYDSFISKERGTALTLLSMTVLL